MHWYRVEREHPAGAALADRHYSRQSRGARGFLPPGRSLVLVTARGDAVWGVVCNRFRGRWRWRCTIFRNESDVRSSDLIREATETTYRFWLRNYGELPGVPLTTEIDAGKVRRKRDPGRCFLRAGWHRVGVVRGLVVFRAPGS